MHPVLQESCDEAMACAQIEHDQRCANEAWIAHPECPTYWFSSLGAIERRTGGKTRALKGTTASKSRYLAIDMHTDSGERVRRYLHRTICELFNGPPPFPDAVCRHLDGNNQSNAATNLAWGTHQENADDTIRHGKSANGERNGMAKLTREQVEAMKSVRASTGDPYHKIAGLFGISTMTAFRAINGRAWK